MADETRCSTEAQRAAVALARARNGNGSYSDVRVRVLLFAAGPPCVTARAAAFLAGALGQAIVEHGALGAELDGADIAAAGLRRIAHHGAIRPDALVIADGLLRAALVARADPVSWLDRRGAATGALAPAVEVLAALLALVDTIHAEPGLGAQIISSVVN